MNAVVLGDHEIPQKTAMHIPVSLLSATVGCGICFDGPFKVKTLAFEFTISTVIEGNKIVVLVVKTNAAPVKLKQGVLLSHALAYDGQIVPGPLDLSRAGIGAFDQNSPVASKASAPASIDSLVKIVDYPEHRDSLLTLLHKYREVIALPGESLGVTDKAEHHIKLNEINEGYRYPLPVLSDLLMSLGYCNTIFSSLDLLSGYWQVPMAPESRKMTAFSTSNGHFELLRVPFGLKSASVTFERMINTLFSDMLGTSVYAYLL